MTPLGNKGTDKKLLPLSMTMNHPVIPNMYTVRELPKNYRRIRGVSMTIPDQAMSLQQIIDRFQRGLPITGNVGEPQFDEENLPDIRTLDITEKMELAQQFSTDLKTLQEKLTAAENKKLKDAQTAALKAEIEAEFDLIPKQKQPTGTE